MPSSSVISASHTRPTFPTIRHRGHPSARARASAQKDDAVELDHGEAGQRSDEHHQRRCHRHTMLSQGCGRPGENRKLCSSSHSETNPTAAASRTGDHPASASQATQGMRWIRPRACPGCVPWSRAAPSRLHRNSRLLKAEWPGSVEHGRHCSAASDSMR